MKFPVQIFVGNYELPLHFIFEVLAYFIAFRLFLIKRKTSHQSINESNWLWILIGAIFGGFFGSRIVAAFENPQALLQSKNYLMHIMANKTVLGGILGGLFGVELIKKIIGEKSSSGNTIVFPLIIGMTIGRIGCFLNGVKDETPGLPSDSMFCMDLGDGICRHPWALYELIFLLSIYIVLKKINPDTKGNLFKIFTISYCVFRFFTENIKIHHHVFLNLSAVQVACIIGLIYYLFDGLKTKNYI